jgi:hypothetical protein
VATVKIIDVVGYFFGRLPFDFLPYIGVAFRVNLNAAKDAAKYECFCLRPTNGRADDQVRRNHSTQI